MAAVPGVVSRGRARGSSGRAGTDDGAASRFVAGVKSLTELRTGLHAAEQGESTTRGQGVAEGGDSNPKGREARSFKAPALQLD